MFDEKFISQTFDLKSPSMGTEVLSPLLYNLIMFERPRKILEIGAGLTSMYILKALFDCDKKIEEERNNLSSNTLIDPYYFNNIRPAKLHVIDDLSHGKTTADKVSQKSQDMGFGHLLEFHQADFTSYADKLPAEELPFDLIWLDCGNLYYYETFKQLYFPLVNKNGGLILIHSLLTNFHGQMFLKQLKLLQATKNFNDFELISLLEPHKRRQNSLTMLRIITSEKYSIHSIQS